MCCNFAVEPKVGVDDWKFSFSQRIENEAVRENAPFLRRTPARIAFANHMNRFIAGDRTPGSQNGRKCWLARTRRLMDR
jgi:hypothetical protein